MTKLDTEKQNFTSLRLRAAAVEKDLVLKTSRQAGCVQDAVDAFAREFICIQVLRVSPLSL